MPSILGAFVIATVVTATSPSVVQQQRARVRFGPGVCGPVDSTYVNTAAATGGQVFPVSREEVSKSAVIMGGASHEELLLWASAEGERDYAIPVDSSIERVMFSGTFDTTGGTLIVVSPNGHIVEQGDRVEDTVLNCGRVVTIASPATGTWHLRTRPTGRFWVVAKSKSELSVLAAEFVRSDGGSDQEFVPIEGQPIAGRPAMLRVRLSADVISTQFALVSTDWRPLLAPELKSFPDDEFVGRITLPTEPFRVMVTGVDESGTSYQRAYAALFHPELIEVIPPASIESAPPRAAFPVAFTIRNYGPAVRLKLVATADGNVLPVEPSTLALDEGADRVALVRLLVPPDSASGRMEVRVTAAVDGAAAKWNSAAAHVTIRREPEQ